MPNATRYRVMIGQVVICAITREDNSQAAKIYLWDREPMILTQSNEEILLLSKVMVPEECRQFVELKRID